MNGYTLKKIISRSAPWLRYSGIHQVFKPVYGGVGHILMFHRVLPDRQEPRIHNHLSLEITPEHLETLVHFLRKKGLEFISMDEVYERLVQGKFDQRFVALTFDDGYRDNLEQAHPILSKHKVPFTIYVTTNFPDRQAILWWYLLEDYLLSRDRVAFQLRGASYDFPTQTQAEKERAFSQIRTLINASFKKEEQLEQLRDIFGGYEARWPEYIGRMTLTWDEIRQLSRDTWASIGAHTVHHYPLTRLNAADLEAEIRDSKVRLEAETGEEIDHFAYPFGKISEASQREFDMVSHCGFKTGTTTRIANLFPAHKNHLSALPRISINRVTDPHVLTLQLNGLLPFLIQKGKRVVTH